YCGGMVDGETFKAYLPGGASGGILPASMADEPLDFGTLEKYGCFVGSHAVVILSEKDDMKAVALNLMRFFEDESCGQCTPCLVEIEGGGVLAASCLRTSTPGMKVKTQTDLAKTAGRMVAELLLNDQPAIEVAHDPDSELCKIVKRLKIEDGRFPKRVAIEVP